MGGFVPIDIELVRYLPCGREYSLPEAMISLKADHVRQSPVSLRGYAELWQWPRKRVKRLFDELGLRVVGQVGRSLGRLEVCREGAQRNRKLTAKGPIKFHDFGTLEQNMNHKVSGQGETEPQTNRKRTTNEPQKVFDFSQLQFEMNHKRTTSEPQTNPSNKCKFKSKSPPPSHGDIEEVRKYTEMEIAKGKEVRSFEGYVFTLMKKGGLTEAQREELLIWNFEKKKKQKAAEEIQKQIESSDERNPYFELREAEEFS